MAAFESIGGIPNEILYDRMKTGWSAKAGGSTTYNWALIGFAHHYGFQPKGLPTIPGQNQRQGQVALSPHPRRLLPRPFLRQSRRSQCPIAVLPRYGCQSARVQATTQRVVNGALVEEKPHLKALPMLPFRSLPKLELSLMGEWWA
jgi:hypothetical protein